MAPNVVTALLFFGSLFLFPLVRMIGGGYDAGEGRVLYPVVAPALVIVGTMMMAGVRSIPWDAPADASPAFLTIVLMPFSMSITDGIAFGFVAHAVLRVATFRAREVHPLVYVFAALFLARYVWLRS